MEQISPKTEPSALWAELARPFPFRDVYLKVQAVTKDRSRGLIFPYIDARAVMERLDAVVGPGNWQDQYETWGENNGLVYVKCTLTIADGVSANGITKEDAGEGRDYKGAVSDALKRAAVKFGIGRYLYSTKTVWSDLDGNGQIVHPDRVKAEILGTYPRASRHGSTGRLAPTG